MQGALQASSSVNLSEPGSAAFSDTTDGIAVRHAGLKDGIENSAPEDSKNFCITQLREIITQLSSEKAELMGKLSTSQDKAVKAEERLQHVTTECSRWSDEVMSRKISRAMPGQHADVVNTTAFIKACSVCLSALPHSNLRLLSL